MKYRTIFISDIHLGTPQCQAQILLDFLKSVQIENMYLVGDIIDIHALKRKWHWPQTHSTVVQKILRLSRSGVNVKYAIGNHDEAIRHILDTNGMLDIGTIKISDSFLHTTANNKKILIIHGDQFDGAMRSYGWLYYLGDSAYTWSLNINRVYNLFTKLFGFKEFSLSSWLKTKVKGVINFVNNFEHLLLDEASRQGVDGILAGHIHTPKVKTIGQIVYINDGDFCESCSVAVEHYDGTIEVVKIDKSGNIEVLGRWK